MYFDEIIKRGVRGSLNSRSPANRCSAALPRALGQGGSAFWPPSRTDPLLSSFLFCYRVAMGLWWQHLPRSGFRFRFSKTCTPVVPISLGRVRIQGLIHAKYTIYCVPVVWRCTWNTSVKQMCIFSGETGWEGKESKQYIQV